MTKSILKYTIAGVFIASFVSGCKKNNLVIDKDPLIAPDAARFVVNPAITATPYNYFIQDNPAPGSKYSIPIGVTNVSSGDRKVKLTYSSTTAVKGTHYTAPDDVIIPAGSSTATLDIQGLFAAYAGGRKDNVKIKLTAGDGYIAPHKYQDSIILTLQQFCPVVLANLSGLYTRTFEGTYGPYNSTFVNVTATSATSATGTLTNIYDSDISATIALDYAVPGAFKVTMNPQQTQYTSGGLPLFVRINPALTTSTFDMCGQTFTIHFQLYTTAGVVATWTTTMAR